MATTKISRTPVYAQLKEAILNKLSAREWKFSEPLPSETKIAEEFGVSVGSVRHAVSELEETGLLVKRQGVGTFVRSYSGSQFWNRFQKIVRKDGRLPIWESKPLRLEVVPAPQHIAEKLKVEVSDAVILVRRKMFENGSFIGVDEAYLNRSVFSGLTQADLEEVKGNLYRLYEEKLGVYIADVTDTLEVRIVDQELQKICLLPIGTLIFVFTRQSRLLNKQTAEVRIGYCAAENYCFHI